MRNMLNHIEGNYKCLVHRVGFETYTEMSNHTLENQCREFVALGESYVIKRYEGSKHKSQSVLRRSNARL